MFAIFFPVAWPTSSGVIADPSARTCIVSLVNQHGRSCRLKLKAGEEKYAVSRYESHGPCVGGGCDVAIWMEEGSYCKPNSFELDAEAESQAAAFRLRRWAVVRNQRQPVLPAVLQLHTCRVGMLHARRVTSIASTFADASSHSEPPAHQLRPRPSRIPIHPPTPRGLSQPPRPLRFARSPPRLTTLTFSSPAFSLCSRWPLNFSSPFLARLALIVARSLLSSRSFAPVSSLASTDTRFTCFKTVSERAI